MFNISYNNLRRTKCTLCGDILGRVIKTRGAYFIHTVTNLAHCQKIGFGTNFGVKTTHLFCKKKSEAHQRNQ